MYKTILISTDGSELAGRGVHQGAELARRFGARVVLVTVSEPWSPPVGMEAAGAIFGFDRFKEAQALHATEIFTKARAGTDLTGLSVTEVHATDTFAAEGIVTAAKEHGADLIVMASHGRRGVGRLLLGSQTLGVLTHTTIPVLVVR